MPEVVVVLNVAIEVAFALLAVRTAVSWAKQPDARHGFLTLALGSLALLILVSPDLYARGTSGRVITDVGIVLFLLSGFGLLMFRDSFLPRSRRGRAIVIAVIVSVGVVGLAAQLPAADAPHSAFQSLSIAALFGVWAYCMLEPVVCRSWRLPSPALPWSARASGPSPSDAPAFSWWS